MDLDELRAYCSVKPGTTEVYPFGPGALVMKVADKLFAIVADEADPLTISLKCDPEEAPMLRESFPAVAPGYHLNKRHWNTVTLDGTVPDDVVRGWIDDSYDLVLDGLPKRVREELRS
ncbi:MAG TPA: MmcQ/YjbR family DNA-binding protein [Actinomycetota bacterium]|nr:MmcQ/YjbR family DNA-binding protein [Actinomycetota bacterium]